MNLVYHKMIMHIFGYPKMYFRISTNRFLDILKYVFGCPKIHKNTFLGIQKSC